MKTIATLLSFVALLAASSVARAQGECDKYTTGYDKTYCFARLFLESDKELNGVYKELRESVKGNVRQQLTDTQRAWIKYRDASCEKQGTIDVDCNYRVNRERTQYLRDRLRECKTGNCRNEVIGRKSWS